MPKGGIEDGNVVDTARFVQWWNDWSTAGDRQQLYAAAWKVNHRSALEFVRALAQALELQRGDLVAAGGLDRLQVAGQGFLDGHGCLLSLVFIG